MNENTAFSQFSERLVDLNLKSTRNKDKIAEQLEDHQPSGLESLLEQLKKQTEAVKGTLSHRSPTHHQEIAPPHKDNAVLIQTNRKHPIIQSIRIEDDLREDSISVKASYQDHNYLNSIPLSTSSLVNNSSAISNTQPVGKPEQAHESNEGKRRKDNANDLLLTSKESLRKSRDSSRMSEKKNAYDNPMVVEVEEFEVVEEEREGLDFYSKSLKKANNTNNIHDIPEERGESDEEDRVEKEEERKRAQLKEEEEKNRKRIEEEETRKRDEKRQQEALESRKREQALEKQKKRETLEKEKEREETERQKEKEEFERKKAERQKKALEKQIKAEALEEQKKREAREKQKKLEEEEEAKKKLKASDNINNDSQLKPTTSFEKNTSYQLKEDANPPSADNFNIQIEDIDDIPELSIEEAAKKKSSKTNLKAQKPINSKKKQEREVENPQSTIEKKQNVDKIKKSPQKAKASKQASLQKQDANNNEQFDPQRKREQIIKEMNAFDVNHPDLTGDFLLLRAFEGKDKHLIKTIPNYAQAIIEAEGNKVFLHRRKAFLDKAYFKNRLELDDSKNDFINFMQKLPLPYPKAICDSYAKLTDKEQLFPKSYNYSNPNLFDNPPAFGHSPIIGPIENVSTFIYKYSLNLCTDLIETALGVFSHWRQVKCDGNSFFRAVMFSILEQFILTKDIESLLMICNELRSLEDVLKERKIDLEPALIVFKLLINELSNDNISEAYSIFTKAYDFMKNDMFDKALIFFLRSVVAQNMKATYALIEEEVKKTNAKLDKSYFMNSIALLENGIDPELDVISMVKYLFNTDIELFWMDGPFDAPTFSHSKLINKSKEANEAELKVKTIYIGFFFSSYHIIYPNEQHIESEVLKERKEASPASFTQLVFIEKNKKNCGSCGRKSSKVYFVQKRFYTCVDCLRDFIDRVLTNRAKAFALGNFVGFECKHTYSFTYQLDYSRDIQLNKDLSISNYDFIEIEERETIGERLFNVVQKICFECGEYLNEDHSASKRKELKCRCCYCAKCLWEKQLKATNGLKVINRFEKFKLSKVECICNYPFDPVDAQRHCSEIADEDVTNAKERMMRYIKTMCFICTKLQINQEDVYSIAVIPEDSSKKEAESTDVPHVICEGCFKAERGRDQYIATSPSVNEKDKDKENQKDNKINLEEVKVIFCNICRKKHKTDIKGWNAKERKVCCNSNDCLIF